MADYQGVTTGNPAQVRFKPSVQSTQRPSRRPSLEPLDFQSPSVKPADKRPDIVRDVD